MAHLRFENISELISNDDISKIRKLNIDFNDYFDKDENTFIHCAISYNAERSLKYLLEKINSFHSPNIHGKYPIHIIAFQGNFEIFNIYITHFVKYRKDHGITITKLFSQTDNDGNTPIHTIARRHHNKLLEYILQTFGRSVSLSIPNNAYYLPIHMACIKFPMKIDEILHTVEMLLNSAPRLINKASDGDRKTPLILAIESGSIELVEHLTVKHHAKVKADPNNKMNLIHLSTIHGELKMVEFFLKQYKVPIDEIDGKSNNVFHFACKYNRSHILEFILSYMHRTKQKMLHKLLRNQNYLGLAPIHEATKKESLTCIELLLEHDPTLIRLQTRAQQTIIDIARTHKKDKLVDYLRLRERKSLDIRVSYHDDNIKREMSLDSSRDFSSDNGEKSESKIDEEKFIESSKSIKKNSKINGEIKIPHLSLNQMVGKRTSNHKPTKINIMDINELESLSNDTHLLRSIRKESPHWVERLREEESVRKRKKSTIISKLKISEHPAHIHGFSHESHIPDTYVPRHEYNPSEVNEYDDAIIDNGGYNRFEMVPEPPTPPIETLSISEEFNQLDETIDQHCVKIDTHLMNDDIILPKPRRSYRTSAYHEEEDDSISSRLSATNFESDMADKFKGHDGSTPYQDNIARLIKDRKDSKPVIESNNEYMTPLEKYLSKIHGYYDNGLPIPEYIREIMAKNLMAKDKKLKTMKAKERARLDDSVIY